MKNLKIIFLGLLLSFGASLLVNKSNAQVVIVRPEAQVGIAPGQPPFAGAVWVAGEYRWDRAAGKYVIVDGRWMRAPRAGVVWVPGHWRPVRRGYVWVAGHWR